MRRRSMRLLANETLKRTSAKAMVVIGVERLARSADGQHLLAVEPTARRLALR